MESTLTLAIALHLIVDVLLQPRWIVLNKRNLRHPAGWVHGAMHLVAMLLVFPPGLALAVALAHVVIDTNRPLTWWRRVYGLGGDTVESARAQDQVAHLACLLAAAWVAHVLIR